MSLPIPAPLTLRSLCRPRVLSQGQGTASSVGEGKVLPDSGVFFSSHQHHTQHCRPLGGSSLGEQACSEDPRQGWDKLLGTRLDPAYWAFCLQAPDRSRITGTSVHSHLPLHRLCPWTRHATAQGPPSGPNCAGLLSDHSADSVGMPRESQTPRLARSEHSTEHGYTVITLTGATLTSLPNQSKNILGTGASEWAW